MPPKEMHKIQMMYALYEDGTQEPIVIDEIKDLTLEEAEPILEEHNFVKVVRCKDCKWFNTVLCVSEYGEWFCADGERREDDR